MSKSGTSIAYDYGADGYRISKAVTEGGVTTNYNYFYSGGKLLHVSWSESDRVHIFYNAIGSPISILYNGTRYYYVRNAQGDIVVLTTVTGQKAVTYSYDAWGKPLTVTGEMAGTLGQANPLRYRGYVYDSETGLYYLGSRYYDPGVGRFINADDVSLLGINNTFNAFNLFAYCLNDPVNMLDNGGESASSVIGAIVGGVTGAALGYLLAEHLGLTGWNKWLLVSAAAIGGAALGAFLGPYIEKIGTNIATKLGLRQSIKISSNRLMG